LEVTGSFVKKIYLPLLFFSTLLLFSHPHVFIYVNMELETFDKVKVTWTFDPIESENKIYFFDDDGDGKLNEKESFNLYTEGFKQIKDYNFFLTVKSDDKIYPVDEILNFNAYVSSEKNLSVSFELNIPVTDKSEQFSVTHFDTSYFISFSEPKKDDLLIIGDFYTAIYKNRTTPYYYDPQAGRGEILDTSKPQKGWLMAYPTEVIFSKKPLLDKNSTYSISVKEKLAQIQRYLYIELSKYLKSVKESKNSKSIFFILLLSLIYGVVHALGPGHRKIILSSYILTKNITSYINVISLSFLSALIHSASGVSLVLILSLVFLKIQPALITELNRSIEFYSYIGVLLLAVTLIILKILSFKKREKGVEKPVGLSLIIISSLVPCPGAVTIILFSLSLKMLNIGIITVVAMSVGIALTLSVISVITLKTKTILKNYNKKSLNIISYSLEWAGLIILLLFSLLMLSSIK